MREVCDYEEVKRLCRYKWKLIGTRQGIDYTIYGSKMEYTIYILERK